MPVFRVHLVLSRSSKPVAGDPRERAATGSSWRARVLAGLVSLVAPLVLAGCKDDGTAPSSFPPAAAYDTPSDFAGEWIGEVEGQVGTLTITPLGPGRYRGLYEGEDVKVEYVLLLEQDLVPLAGTTVAGNRALFKWQDGRGGQGDGWLLINREDSALTGAFGEKGMLERPWTFIRVE